MKFCEPCERTVAPAADGDCPWCGAGLTPIPRPRKSKTPPPPVVDLMAALKAALPQSNYGRRLLVEQAQSADAVDPVGGNG
jgi:hypothetical protein